MEEPGLMTTTRAIAACVLLAALLASPPAHAYIGPGAGFALLYSTFIFVLVFFSIVISLLIWPIRAFLSWYRGRKANRRAKVRRLVVLGLDGIDPKLCEKLMDEGRLPHFSSLSQTGTFRPLGTSTPPVSPVAWSCFMTGCNPGRHAIYDFFTRDPHTYLPVLSSTKISGATRFLKLGKLRIPRGKPSIRLLRRSKPFWTTLGEQGVTSTVIRVPITFPPERFNGLLLSGMCVPDLLGTQGTFTLFTTEPSDKTQTTGGVKVHLPLSHNTVRGEITGPPDPLAEKPRNLTLPFEATLNGSHVDLKLDGTTITLEPGTYSPWTRLRFSSGLTSVQGIARFLVTETDPHLKLYVSPINIDPEKPALPISHPLAYSVYLSKRFTPYATLGLAEDTWALNEKAIGDQAFLDQTYLNHDERERMFFDALDMRRKGLVACVFDTSDRIQHTFWRYLNPSHPALEKEDRSAFSGQIEDMYERMDRLVGKTISKLSPKDALIVLSDHGFNDFSRGVNLNSWLHENGYLVLKKDTTGSSEWLEDVDWSRTKAYSMGMVAIFLNLKGREARGIVEPDQASTLKQEIINKLSGLSDNSTTAINHVWDRDELYSGPYVKQAPDLTVGFNAGYRASWSSVQGKVTPTIFEDNHKAWSGDHCLDPSVVPGILFTSFKHTTDSPHIMDVAPTALRLLGADIPPHVEGKPLALS
jgi:predicted AlkP superfamily phosphohydrolase/phosphomutase